MANQKQLALLRWAGAKKWLISRMQLETLGSKRYVEPFLGSAAVFLNLDPFIGCIGGDANKELIETFRTVRDEPKEVLSHLKRLRNDEDTYYKVRALDRNSDFAKQTSAARAARLIYLNHTCFNGLYRVNSRGQFNVPYGKRKITMEEISRKILPVSKVLREKRETLGAENLYHGDFREILKLVTPGDFVYLDPPYLSEQKSKEFVNYTATGFEFETYFEILTWMQIASSQGVKAILSNTFSQGLVDRAHNMGLTVEQKVIRRSIAASPSHRQGEQEVLIANFT